MRAEIISAGTELLLGEITDTNAQVISANLKKIGVDVFRRITVGDNPARLKGAFEEALGRADIVISTGGLGPTDDDLTAAALAKAMGRNLAWDEDAWSWTADWFHRRGRTPTESDRKQAMIVEGGIALRNDNGTAPGQAVFADGKLAAILPGPPREMVPMLIGQVIPLIKKHFPDLPPLWSRDLRIAGIGESRVGEIVRDLTDRTDPTVAPYAGAGEVRLRIATKCKDETVARKAIGEVESEIRRRLGEYIYGVDDDNLEIACGNLLKKKGLTLAIAESLTGGLVSHRITQVPGSSAYFKMGVVAYHPSIKVTCLGVDPQAAVLNDAVNPDVARSMATGIMALAGAKVGLSTTGFAGPGGGTDEEPMGSTYIAVTIKDTVVIDRQVFSGSRSTVKESAAQRALYVLWNTLRSL